MSFWTDLRDGLSGKTSADVANLAAEDQRKRTEARVDALWAAVFSRRFFAVLELPGEMATEGASFEPRRDDREIDEVSGIFLGTAAVLARQEADRVVELAFPDRYPREDL